MQNFESSLRFVCPMRSCPSPSCLILPKNPSETEPGTPKAPIEEQLQQSQKATVSNLW